MLMKLQSKGITYMLLVDVWDSTTPLENLLGFSSTDKHVPDAADVVTLAQKK